jgi:hypothetical protein
VADIVRDCTDPGKVPGTGTREPWLLRKQRYIASLIHKPCASLLVTAADKAHNARDHLLDGRRDSSYWSRTTAGLEASAWYFLQLHGSLRQHLPGSRSIELLGFAVNGLLTLPDYTQLVPREMDPIDWAAGYARRQQGPAS